MAGALTLLIGAAAGVGRSALRISLWARRRRSAVSVRNQHDRRGGGGALLDAPPHGRGCTTHAAQEANLGPAGPQAERDERSSLVEISDLVRPASAAARSAVGADLVTCGLDIAGDGDRAPPREAARPTHWPAEVTDTDLSVDPGPASAEAPVRPAAGRTESAPPEAEYEAPTACPSDKAQSQEDTHLDGALRGEAYGEPGHETDDTAEAAGGAECGAAESAPLVSEGAAAPPVDNQQLAPEPVTASVDALSDPVTEDTGGEAANVNEPALTRPRPSKLAQHRDRRGQRRVLPRQPAPSELPPPVGAAIRAPAEAKLRLMLHPIRRAAALSAVLARPAGYPDRVTLLFGGGEEVSAYGEDRYDDVDLEWTADLLSGEVRLDSKEGYQWLRSGRRIHILGEVADEPGVVSVGSAALSSPSTIICRDDDAAVVRAASEACGSPALVSHDRWSGIPDGWTILSGYRPTHAAVSELTSGLTGLDPGVGSEIRLSGGLRIRSVSFAEGRPPRIEITPYPSGAIITIDGQDAELGEDGAWSADGWDRPGDHLVDVVPGPSATYRILEDPWSKDSWETWDAHPERFSALRHAPWAVAQVCGAAVSGPAGEYVVAADAILSVVCLGLRRGAVALRGRPDAPVAVGLLGEPPAFLISASGPRRSQGRIAWLSPSAPSPSIRAIILSGSPRCAA
jgi:hypothetical protein